MAKHRRRNSAVQLAVGQYELLVTALRHHRPGERSGLCVVCGVGWPCAEVRLPIRYGRMSGELR